MNPRKPEPVQASPLTAHPEPVKLPLAKGKGFALIDPEDYHRVAKTSWQLLQQGSLRYATGWFEGRQRRLHRVILNAPTGIDIDHINGNGLDNRRHNLRFATRSQNMANLLRPRSRSGRKGVWRVQRNLARPWHYHSKHLGYFATRQEASDAYDEAAQKAFGVYARPNEQKQGRSA